MPSLSRAQGLALLVVFALLVTNAFAQSGRRSAPAPNEKKTGERPPDMKAEPTPSPTPEPTPPLSELTPEEIEDDGDAVRVETDLVTVPVVVSDRRGLYIPDIKQDEFSVTEDGAPQQVAFFANVTEPFHVVLVLDTSASTTVEKLNQVQRAAVAFVEQLDADDRLKVISFDDEVRELSDFTGDRAKLAGAISSTRPGKGSRVYDAFDLAYRSLRRVKGRKAIVFLTDGVDFHSRAKSYDDNRKAVEESDVLVYPVRFDTREETERLARAQSQGGGAVDLGSILGDKIPGLPGSVIISPRGTTRNDPRNGRRDPRGGGTNDPRDTRPGDRPFPDATTGPNDQRPTGMSNDSISNMLDGLYRIADDYLEELSNTSGGRLLRADNPSALPFAFAQIAAELRTQYSLGYYPSNRARDGKFRKVRVRTTRKDAAVRARPGYRARKEVNGR
jgi:VWFA-related protein